MPSQDTARYSGKEQTDWTSESRDLQAITTYSEKLEARDPDLANELRTIHLQSTNMGQASWLQAESTAPERLLHAFQDSNDDLDQAQLDYLAKELARTLTMPAREAVQDLQRAQDQAARTERYTEEAVSGMDKRLETAEEHLREGLLNKTEQANQLNQQLRDRFNEGMKQVRELASSPPRR